jgi:DNA-binding transcriptional ArsR family regulator
MTAGSRDAPNRTRASRRPDSAKRLKVRRAGQPLAAPWASGSARARPGLALDKYISIRLYRYMVIEGQSADSLSAAFQALSDPTRRAILTRLAGGEASVSELMAPFKLSQPTISKHLKVLERAGLIKGGRDAQRRPRRLSPKAMQDVADWIEPFRRQWETRLDNLEAYLTKMKQEEK